MVVMVGLMPAAACTSSMGTLTLAADEGMGLTVTAAVSMRLPRPPLLALLLPPAAEAAATLPPLSIFWNRLPRFAAKTGFPACSLSLSLSPPVAVAVAAAVVLGSML